MNDYGAKRMVDFSSQDSNKKRNKVEVNILGQRLRLKADEDPQRIEQLANYVNRKIDEVSSVTPVAPAKLAVLAALNIADDYFRALEESRQFKRDVAARSRVLIEEIDDVIPAHAKRR